MLSKQHLSGYHKQLDLKVEYCKVIRLGSGNIKAKLKDKNFFSQHKLSNLYAEPNSGAVVNTLEQWSNIATFLIYVSEFEAILYKIFSRELTNYQGIYNGYKAGHEFLDFFIRLRGKSDFYPFSTSKELIKQVSATDLNYLSEIIALRNYFAHGQKEPNDLVINKSNSASPNLINNLDAINDQLKKILEKIQHD